MGKSDDISIKRQIDQICNELEEAWSPDSRPDFNSYLEKVDDKYREQLMEALLEVDRELSRNAGVGETSTTAPKSKSGTKRIGPFKLLQQIGEGGMGTVWMAEQEEPVKRRVALKVIKAGMDSKQVIARFEAERQALAMMDHQNIAKVLDARMTDDGRPYFAMELVQGISITKYCDDNKLTPEERLELFIPVCTAIQHAHQKGIIHRDLKPTNVLVTLYDGKPVPKVIDFGLAKALQSQMKLTEKTMFTEFGQVVGTLQYMSPEQAEMNALDVDTRTDIYSLGVMLYELLTGSTPLEAETVKKDAFLQILQTIRETEPPRPSARLSSSGDAISGISAQRKIEPRRLQQILRGELDWIIMKALEKDRTRRYETVNSFALDVKRFLDSEPVEARPASVSYRIRKLVSRHRVPIAITSLFLVIIGVASATLVVQRDTNQKQLAAKTMEINRTRTRELVDSLMIASPEALPYAVSSLDSLQELAIPILRRKMIDAPSEAQQLNAAMALAEFGQVENELIVRAIENALPDQCSNIVRVLNKSSSEAVSLLRNHSSMAEKEKNWQLRSRIAIVMLHLGDASIAAEMCRIVPDPIQRTMFIRVFSQWHADLLELANAVRDSDVATFRSGICLAVGDVKFSESIKDVWKPVLKNWYIVATDSGTHSAAFWAMRQLEIVPPRLAETNKPIDGREWWHATGLRFVKIPPIQVRGKRTDSIPASVGESFWLSDTEITVELFKQFITDEKYTETRPIPMEWRVSSDRGDRDSLQLPARNVSWFDAVMFCNWLSAQLGLDPCYAIELLKNEIDANKRYRVKLRHSGGIRLPSEVEWEYSCRASSTTTFSFGDGHQFLADYGWVFGNSRRRAQLVATKRCNAWGLFDLHGNVWEWCGNIDSGSFGATRGGGNIINGNCSSSSRGWNFRARKLPCLGFRVVCGPTIHQEKSQ